MELKNTKINTWFSENDIRYGSTSTNTNVIINATVRYQRSRLLLNNIKSRLKSSFNAVYTLLCLHLNAFYFHLDPIKDCASIEETYISENANNSRDFKSRLATSN